MIKDIIYNNENVTPNEKEIQILKEHFPSCFRKDNSFDIEIFKEFLSNKVTISNEGYELRFLGKSYAKLLAALETETVIVPDEEHNNKPENINSKNVYISGDNLDGLKHMLKSYAGTIKCIYIDPPYNTGSDGFVYNDNFSFTEEALVEKLGVGEEHAKRILDLTTKGSASHSAWLMFMYPRLQLAKELLDDETGVLFVSIDDNEQSDLRMICDAIFGEQNLKGQITVVANPRGRDYGGVARMHDYLLVYTKKADYVLNLIEDKDNNFPMFDDKGGFNLRELRNRNIKFNKENRPNLYYPFYINPSNADENGLHDISLKPIEGWTELYPLESQGINVVWRWGKQKSEANLNTEIKAKPMRNGSYMIVEKYREPRTMARSVWWDKDTNTEKGTLQVKELMGAKVFDYPKPVEMLMRVCEMGTNPDNEDCVVDFFSGSGSMAHAVMQQNVKDNGNRQFIMVQLQEHVKKGSEAEKAGYDTIDQIGIERIIRAAKKIKEDNLDINADLGFKHYTLSDVSDDTIDKMEHFDIKGFITDDTVYNRFGSGTILATWLIHDGYTFNNTCMTIDLAGYTAFWCENHLYLLNPNMSEDAIKALIDKYNTEGEFNPQNIVLFGYCFNYVNMENLKTNIKILRDSEKNLKVNIDIRY